MSHTTWSSHPGSGAASPYHLDPSPGGAPVVSPDGHWRWDGDHWVLRDDPEDADESDTDPEPDQDTAASLD